MKLYGYWRSSAAYRVRIALNLKAIKYETIPVHLIKDGGEQHKAEYLELNPNHLVPTLVDGDLVLNQSLAIIDYLDREYPENSVYPIDKKLRAKTQALALDIACEIHPINNLRVQQYIVNELNISVEQKEAWVDYWMTTGFNALEEQLKKTAGKFCVGDTISLADICLVPQVYNARRFNIDLTIFPTISRIVDACNCNKAFIDALPENQVDAQ